jgi:hypothetical protein
MADLRLARRVGWLFALGCVACAAAPRPAATAPLASAPLASAPLAAEAAVAGGFGHGFRIIEAKGQGLEFPLPDPAGWRRDTREKHSWVARHQKSSSELVVRAWRFDDVARPEDCEREARLWRRLPQPLPSELIETGQRLLAGAYRGKLSVGIRPVAPSSRERLLGYALGFGSDARSCLLLWYSTAAAGPGARRVVTERLAVVAGSVFERARRLDIDTRIVVPRL